jgi:hypothetical protein
MRADSTAGPSQKELGLVHTAGALVHTSQKELGLVARLTLHHRPSLRASLP